MKHIEQAIREAVENGGFTRWGDEIKNGCIMSGASQSDLFLDPTFWQALGKARGWPLQWPQPYQTGNGDWLDITWWEYKWHEFVRHLADGKDAESYFASLL